MRNSAALREKQSPSFRMPAEWEPHAASWLAWPHFRGDWPGKFEAIPWVYAEIVRYLSRGEDVNIIVAGKKARTEAQKILKSSNVNSQRIRFHLWPTNRVWLRDSGPIFICRDTPRYRIKDRLATTNWRFNGWAKYSDWKHDARLPELIAAHAEVEQFVPVFPGHSIVREEDGRPAAVTPTPAGFELVLEEPSYGVARGQAAVLYEGDAVVGCGVISSAAYN